MRQTVSFVFYVSLFLICFCQPNLHAYDEDYLKIAAYVDREVITRGELKVAVERTFEARQLKKIFQGEDYASRWKNLEKRVLQELITKKLIAKEARKILSAAPQEEIDLRIASEIHAREFSDRDELRVYLRNNGVSWEDWIKQLTDEIHVEQYQGYMTRRQYLVSPEEVLEFYKQHQEDELVEHRSVDGYLRRVKLRSKQTAVVNHLIIKPNLTGKVAINSVQQLSKIHARIRVIVERFKKRPPSDVSSWVKEVKEKNPDIEMIYVQEQECEHGAGTLGSLDEVAFELPIEKWSQAELILEPTRYVDIQTERWDVIQTLVIKPGKKLPLREVRDEITHYLRLSIRDREMQILKDKLWKTSSIKITSS